jgi:hypothetical protein
MDRKWWRAVRKLPPVTMAGLGLILAGIVSLCLSDEVATGWWQGTLQALGVGLIVGGLVDVLAISKLNQAIQSASEKDRADIKGQAEAIVAQIQAASDKDLTALGRQEAAFMAQIPDGEVVQIPAFEVERYLRLLRNNSEPYELRAAVLHRLNFKQRSFLLDHLDRTLRDQLVDAGVYRD